MASFSFEDPSLITAIRTESGGDGQRSERERLEVLNEVFFDSNPNWFQPFLVMLLISSGVAALGLSQNSAATVIGAMIIAPLGSPITSLGGAIALGWPRQIIRMLIFVAAGSLAVVATAWGIGLLLPPASPTVQILERTNPDLRDLGVALLAGGAGAFARTRKEISSSLVGVAIAVALVPPLCAVGLLLEDGYGLLAKGAALLFSANLVGIALAVALVMILTAYAPRPRLPRSWAGRVLALALVAGAALVAVPLYHSYELLSQQARRLAAVHKMAASVLKPSSASVIRNVNVEDSVVKVDIDDGGENLDAEEIRRKLAGLLGPDVTVTVAITK